MLSLLKRHKKVFDKLSLATITHQPKSASKDLFRKSYLPVV